MRKRLIEDDGFRNISLSLALTLTLLVISGGLCQTAARPDKWARRVPSSELKNWYQIDGDVYRSEQPNRKGFQEIRDHGIKTVVNLRSMHSDDSKAKGLGLVLVRVPMTAAGFEETDIVSALKAIKEAPKPVLFHCQHGADRAGVVAAMYRVVFQGWTKDEAIAELMEGGFGFHKQYRNIPEFIRNADIDKIESLLGFSK